MKTTEMRNGITPKSCLYTLYIHSAQNETDSNLPSRLELAFLLDSGASISRLDIPAYRFITQMFNVCNQDQDDTPKTLTIANHSEIPFEHQFSVTCFSSIETKSKYFMIPFALVDTKENAFGTQFFEKYKRKIIIQDSTMNFKHSFNDQPRIASFTIPNEKISFSSLIFIKSFWETSIFETQQGTNSTFSTKKLKSHFA